MGKYVVRRLIQMIPVVLGATFLIFAMVFSLPGDPTAGKCGERPCPPEYVQQFREEHNLNDPLPVQYGKYLGKLATGDLGTNYYDVPVAEDLQRRYTITGRLALMAVAFQTGIGILAGVLAGVRKGGFIDSLVMVSTLFAISIPVFVTGFALQYIFGIELGVVPATVPGFDAPTSSLILPAYVLGSMSIAYVARLTRTNLAENLRADYVRTAVAKGLTKRRVVGVHALRNSLIPVVTFIGYDFGALLGGAIVTERIFNIQGVGGYIFTSINARDGIAVVSAVTVLVIVYLLVNLIVDLLYGVLDPRISHD